MRIDLRPLAPAFVPTLVFALVLAAACDSKTDEDGRDAPPGGTLVVAVPSDASNLLPPLIADVNGKAVADLVFDQLAELGPDMVTIGDTDFQPALARTWAWGRDSLSIAFSLRPDARFHDGHPVRATDVKFSHDLAADSVVGSPFRPLIAAVDSVTVADSLTVVFWFGRRYPEQFHDAVYHLHVLPEHLLASEPRAALASSAFARNPVGSGRFRLARWEAGSRIELVADTGNYRGRPALDRVIWSITPNATTGLARLAAGEVDFVDPVRAEQLAELSSNADLRLVTAPGLDYAHILLNSKADGRPHPVLGDRGVRRALTMALDRRAMVRSVFDSLASVAVGPATRAQPLSDTTVAQLPFDTAAAARLLDSLGWRDSNGDGVRERAGVPLRFGALVPSVSRPRVRMAVLAQEQLRRVGARMDIEEIAPNAYVARVVSRDFDAAFHGSRVGPSMASLREWTVEASRSKDASNYASYENPTFDAQLDSALVTSDVRTARRHMRLALETIVADAPAIWLYEPKYAAAVHRRFVVPRMRPDAWWASIPTWSVPDSARIDRDRLGLVAAKQ